MPKTRDILAIDIGNTTAHGAYFSGGRMAGSFRIPTPYIQRHALRILQNHIPLAKKPAVVIASVVPKAGAFLKKMVPSALKCPVYLIGKDIAVPIQNKYKNPRQVGADRLLSAYAAFHKYKKELIVIDFGTAITFDVVSQKGEYLGGAIAPGIELTLEALFQKTALLPRIRLAHPKGIVGRDTVESIRAGASFGIGGLCDRIVQEISKSRHSKPLSVATGGYARFMSRYCSVISKIDEELVLKGIVLTFQNFSSKTA